ncbi:centrosomin isoform X2 [Phlebotomus papatasi]|uniref:centrosomin isoform X2 n=1 Tax=Phlebotomus papatasi TaxID=29031 RepID=UPI0024838C33|nr:centrosomin isoform X2 [Phlebotomus papatasi]
MDSKTHVEQNESKGDIANTTPGQLQDVTMDNSYSYGFRSPSFSVCGQGSPGQGRTVRDYEEQMTTLQRENFNLRLRIYFLEEKLNGSAMGQGTESLFKQNVDLKVEIEAQKKELQEKNELLTQAANVMKYMEDMQKKMEEDTKATESELRSRIDLLELEISEMQKIYGPSSPKNNLISLVEGDCGGMRRYSDGDAEMRMKELQGKVDQLNRSNEDMKEAMAQLEAMHQEKGLKIKEFESKTEQLSAQNAQLREKIESLEKTTKMTEELKVQLFEAREQLAEKMCDQQDLVARLQEKTQAHEDARAAIQKLVKNYKDLQEEYEQARNRENGDLNNQKKPEDIETIRSQLESKDVEITNLRAEILRTMEQKNAEIYDLKTEVKRKTTNLQRLINKDLWDKNREIERLTQLLSERNGVCGEIESPVKVAEMDQLHSQFTDAQYNEAVERNVYLQRKLDALRQKLCLNPDVNEKTVSELKQELKMAQTDAENANKWRKECAEVCSILTLRLEELAGFLDSLLKHKDVLGALCADRRHAMRKAIDRSLDLSRSINNSSLNLGITLSEQSLMQMTGISGILDESFPESVLSNKENLPGNCSMRESVEHVERVESAKVIEALKAEILTLRTELEKTYKRKEQVAEAKKRSHRVDGHSESESWSEPDRNVSAARIGLDERVTKVVQGKPYNSSTDEDATAVTPVKKTLAAEKIAQLETLATEKENKLLELQMAFVERENQLKEERLRVTDQLQAAQKDLEAQKVINGKLQEEVEHLRGSLGAQEGVREQIERLESELEEKRENLESLMKERDRAAVDVRVLELKMQEMTKDAEYMREKHIKEVNFRMEKMRKELEVELEGQLQRKDLEYQEILNRDFVSRSTFQQKREELDVLRRRLDDAQATIDGMSEAEIELRALLAEYERKSRDVQKCLDDATMQASRAVLERSRAVNECGQMEAALKDLQERCSGLAREKVDLNGRIAHLESLTATLQNQLVKATVKREESRERSSDDGGRLDNSSPDLGIDSDVARVSSSDAGGKKSAGETKPARLSSASTVEMRKSDASGESLCDHKNNCQVIKEENIELKKRLVRTKRQLEETVQRLKQSNKHKEQIERDIQTQILKTHSVLKQVRSNMETEAEKRNIPLPPRPSEGNN